MASSPEIGLGLVTFGLAFLFLGVVLFFDKGLLAMGNVSQRVCVGGHLYACVVYVCACVSVCISVYSAVSLSPTESFAVQSAFCVCYSKSAVSLS